MPCKTSNCQVLPANSGVGWQAQAWGLLGDDAWAWDLAPPLGWLVVAAALSTSLENFTPQSEAA